MSDLALNTNKILSIVVSRNRGCQLDLLLRGYRHYASQFDIKVIHRYDDGFKAGLNKVRAKFPEVEFIEEKDFRGQILGILKGTQSRTVTFMTDDTCWRVPFPASDSEVAKLLDDAHMFSLLLRNGINTIRQCHYTNEMQQPLDIQQVWNTQTLQVGSYNFRQYRFEQDWGRPVSLDGSLHEVDQLRNILIGLPWTNPRSLDDINSHRDKIRGMTGLCKESFVVTQSVNQSFDGARADNWGHFVQYSLEELEQQYVSGKMIKMDQEKYLIQSSHVEIKFEWEEDV